MSDAIPQSPRNKESACVGGCVKDASILDAILHFIWSRFEKVVDDDKTQMEGYEIHAGEEVDRTKSIRKQQQQQERKKRRLRESSLVITVPGPDPEG